MDTSAPGGVQSKYTNDSHSLTSQTSCEEQGGKRTIEQPDETLQAITWTNFKAPPLHQMGKYNTKTVSRQKHPQRRQTGGRQQPPPYPASEKGPRVLICCVMRGNPERRISRHHAHRNKNQTKACNNLKGKNAQ